MNDLGFQGAGFGCGVAALKDLDLIYGHISTISDYDDSIPFNKPLFTPFNNGGVVSSNWFKRSDSEYKPFPIVARLQPFNSGGYEVTFRWLDMQKIGRMIEAVRAVGKRVLDADKGQNQDDIIRAASRASRTVRLRVKSMGCDRLLTLTRREKEIEHFWSLDEWAAAWKKFNRLLAKAGVVLEYVAVPEFHKKGNFHLHAAIKGHVNIKLLRQCWWVCCGGRGLGNVDVSYKKGVTDYKRRAGIARYVSKYISKQFSTSTFSPQFFNKKRYWASKHTLPSAKRYILDSSTIVEALLEFASLFGFADDFVLLEKAFKFPNGTGAWFDYDVHLDAVLPF